ncbi:pirin family protein [Candidatus Nitrosacidococcus tergens]|uniref:Putative Quercetin 2,3-dioxygenase n=1 Tax=Candidatus Nitrosacidococcus tergens TaxID=553981 RepID=A0A7G1Q8J4_9GAMM|nr:pirin family protein [Candidatus Nitrosacidococcus tergens]CAB1275291.1 putative Quercetin 2,3-dioxygenase [Candidatus Nitrosacidococcus tergens]
MKQRQVMQTVQGQSTYDGAGVHINRVMGTSQLLQLDPFLLLDEFKSDNPNDYIAGFPDHPHRGFETVTYMLAGRMRHGDNQGNQGLLTAGSVQWMTAGRGIVHSEMPEQEDGLLWGFQLWVNLPAQDKMTIPRYQDIQSDRIPVFKENKAKIKVIAGEISGHTGPVDAPTTQPIYLDIELSPHTSHTIALSNHYNAFIYVYVGIAQVGTPAKVINQGTLAVLDSGNTITVTTTDESARLLLIAGQPLKEPIVRYGPFVMNSKEEIQQALADYQSGTL